MFPVSDAWQVGSKLKYTSEGQEKEVEGFMNGNTFFTSDKIPGLKIHNFRKDQEYPAKELCSLENPKVEKYDITTKKYIEVPLTCASS